MKLTKYNYILSLFPPKLSHSLKWIIKRRKIFPWNNPITYDEKIHWLIVNYWGKNESKYADKYCVREYVKKCGLEHILPKLLGVYDSVSEIDFSVLPDQFILKTNHASGKECYTICFDIKTFDKQIAIKKMNVAIKYDLWRITQEYHYKYIKRKIICEELLVQANQDYLTDYKVVCSYGCAMYVLVCHERDNGRDYYDTKWNYCDFIKEEFRSGFIEEKPEKLDELLEYAEILSKPFPLARVDFYIVDNRIYFGEITLTPSGGYHNNLNMKGQKALGEIITMPKMRC